MIGRLENGTVMFLDTTLPDALITHMLDDAQPLLILTRGQLKIGELPTLDVHVIPSDARPGGVGETAVPPVAPSICNAIFAATGKRLRTLPIAAHKFV